MCSFRSRPGRMSLQDICHSSPVYWLNILPHHNGCMQGFQPESIVQEYNLYTRRFPSYQQKCLSAHLACWLAQAVSDCLWLPLSVSVCLSVSLFMSLCVSVPLSLSLALSLALAIPLAFALALAQPAMTSASLRPRHTEVWKRPLARACSPTLKKLSSWAIAALKSIWPLTVWLASLQLPMRLQDCRAGHMYAAAGRNARRELSDSATKTTNSNYAVASRSSRIDFRTNFGPGRPTYVV